MTVADDEQRLFYLRTRLLRAHEAAHGLIRDKQYDAFPADFGRLLLLEYEEANLIESRLRRLRRRNARP